MIPIESISSTLETESAEKMFVCEKHGLTANQFQFKQLRQVAKSFDRSRSHSVHKSKGQGPSLKAIEQKEP